MADDPTATAAVPVCGITTPHNHSSFDDPIDCAWRDRQPTTAAAYSCPGREMPQPKGAPFEGYVACYRAGHKCPPKVAITTEDDTHVMTVYRCPCCGDMGVASCVPKEWLHGR